MSNKVMAEVETVRYLRRALGVAAFILLIAPPVGFWVYFALMSLRFSELGAGVSVEALKAVPEAIAVGSLFSYLLGGMPALISAVPSAWVVWRHGTLAYWQAIGFAVVASVLVVLGLQISAYPDVEWRAVLGMIAFVAALSVVSAVICRWMMGRVGLVPPGSHVAGKS